MQTKDERNLRRIRNRRAVLLFLCSAVGWPIVPLLFVTAPQSPEAPEAAAFLLWLASAISFSVVGPLAAAVLAGKTLPLHIGPRAFLAQFIVVTSPMILFQALPFASMAPAISANLFGGAGLFGDGDLTGVIVPMAVFCGASAALIYAALATFIFFVARKNENRGYVAATGVAALILFIIAKPYFPH